jgi:hypothetical protein
MFMKLSREVVEIFFLMFAFFLAEQRPRFGGRSTSVKRIEGGLMPFPQSVLDLLVKNSIFSPLQAGAYFVKLFFIVTNGKKYSSLFICEGKAPL